MKILQRKLQSTGNGGHCVYIPKHCIQKNQEEIIVLVMEANEIPTLLDIMNEKRLQFR